MHLVIATFLSLHISHAGNLKCEFLRTNIWTQSFGIVQWALVIFELKSTSNVFCYC